jgi:hypothetical protein
MKKSFQPSEFNHFSKMNGAFLARVEAFRGEHGYPTLLTSDFRDHPTSAHGKGVALDMVLYSQWKVKQPHWFEIYTRAVNFGFAGVGIYFDWNAFGKPVIGLHIDDLQDSQRRPLQWIRTNGNRYYYLRGGRFLHSDGSELTLAQIEDLARHY